MRNRHYWGSVFSEVTRTIHHVPEIPCWSRGPRWAVSKPRGLWCMFWNRPLPDLLHLLDSSPKKRRIKVTRSAPEAPVSWFFRQTPEKQVFAPSAETRQRAHRPLPTAAHAAVPLLSAPRRWPALGGRGCNCVKKLSSKSWSCNTPGGSQKGCVTRWEGQTVTGLLVFRFNFLFYIGV